MRIPFLLLSASLTLPLLLSCGSERNDFDYREEPDAGNKAFITATNAGVAAAETSTIIDMVGLLGTPDERLLDARDITLPCAQLGYGGNGMVTLQGQLQQPGDKMKIIFNGCTLAGAPLSGTVEATLVEYGQDDTEERYTTRYRYQKFLIGSGTNLLSLTGSLAVESRYHYQSETSTTTRTSTSLQLAQGQTVLSVEKLECIDAYTGVWDTAPFTMECQLRFNSLALGGTLSVVTVEPFRGTGGENRPTSGELHINGANSKTRFIAQQDGEHVLIQWDQNGDGRFEGQLLRSWDELKQDILDWSSLLNP